MAGEKVSAIGRFVGLKALSDELAGLVESAAAYTVRVEDGSRLTGTGVVWSEDGTVVTSSHGLERDEDLSIESSDGTVRSVTLVGRDPESDLAVLKASNTGLIAAPKEENPEVKVGQLVVAIGNPGRQGLQATLGLINSRYEVQTNDKPEYILKTDAVLYPGFSGSPLIGATGKVVGLVNRWFGRGSSVALGVPIVEQVVASLLEHGRVQRGYLGIRTQIVPLPETVLTALERPQASGLLIVQVEPGSPADVAGVLLGDILIGIDSESLVDVDGLRHHLRAGRTVQLHTLRGGQQRNVEATIVAQR